MRIFPCTKRRRLSLEDRANSLQLSRGSVLSTRDCSPTPPADRLKGQACRWMRIPDTESVDSPCAEDKSLEFVPGSSSILRSSSLNRVRKRFSEFQIHPLHISSLHTYFTSSTTWTETVQVVVHKVVVVDCNYQPEATSRRCHFHNRWLVVAEMDVPLQPQPEIGGIDEIKAIAEVTDPTLPEFLSWTTRSQPPPLRLMSFEACCFLFWVKHNF